MHKLRNKTPPIRREKTKWNKTLIVLPSYEPPFIDGTL